MNKKSNFKNLYLGSILVILSAFCFGLMPVFTKIAYAGGSNTFTVCVHRFTFACIGFAIINMFRPNTSFKITLHDFKFLFLMSLFYATTPMLLYSSYNMISSTLASSLHFTYPLWVIFLMTIIFRERLTRKQLICTLLCVAGMILLYTPGQTGTVIGMILAIGSGLTYASYVVTLGRAKLSLPVTVVSFYITLLASIELWIVCSISGKLIFSMPLKGLLSEIGLAFFSTVLALILFQTGIKYCSEIKASLLSTFEPVTSVLFGIFFFHDHVTVRLIIGIILILASTVILVIKKTANSTK